MLATLIDSLSNLKGQAVQIVPSDIYEKPSVRMDFSDGTALRMGYWRLLKDGKEVVSSFDHEQQYGLAGPIDAILELQKALERKTCGEVQFDRETGDLLLQFTEAIKLQVFAFSSYEVWEIRFADGTGEYSNHAK